MAQKRTGGSSGINNDIKNFADSIMKMVDESNQNSQINKTIEVVAKTKGVSATTQEIRELNKEISSIKKNLKDGDITEEMYANSAKLNESVKSNVKILEEFQKKAKDKKNNLLEFNIGDTKKFYETYYTLEEQLSKMGKEMPNKFKQTFNDIQKNSKAIFKGSAQQINDYYDLSLDELKATAIKRANRGMTDVVSEIKSQYKANAETKIAESISKRDKLVAANSSSASVQNLKKLNELGFTNKGEIDRSKVLFNNYSQCEKVVESIRENLSKISSEDSEKNIEVIKSANTLLAELETRLTNLGETNSFERQSLATQEHINNLFSSGKIDDDTVSSSKEQLESLRQEVDKGEMTAEQAANAYSSYCEQLVETARAAQETDEALRKVNSVLWKSMNSQGEFKTWKEMFQQGDVNDKTISKLEKAVSVLRENSSNLDFDQYDKLLKAEDLLYELRNVQEGISDYSNDYNAHYNNSEKIIQNAQESADATREEARSFEAVEETASEAATSKEKFVEANKEVFDSIVNTLKWLGDEDEGFRSLANNLNTALNQFGDFSSSSNFTNFIEALDKIIQKIDEVATKTSKIGLNLNIKNDSTMEAQQAAQATDAYYGTILSRMRTKARKIETNMPNVATLLFENPRVSDVSKRYNDVLSDAQEALSLGNIDKVGRSNEENVKAYLQYFEQLRTARDNVKRILSEYKQMIKTGVDAEGRTLSEEDKSAITQMIAEYKEQWSFLLSNGALPSYTVNEVSKKVNEINGVTSMGKQSATNKRKKTGNSIAEMLGIDQTDTEGTNIALEKIVNTLEEIRGILSSISQKDVFGELFDDKDGRLDTIATKITNIIQKVKELNAVSGTSAETTSATSSDTGIFANEGKADIEAYTESIKEGESKVEDSVSDVMESGVESGKDTLSIHSPSVVYRIMAQNSMEGYILGVEDKKFEVMNAVGDVLKSGFLNNEADSKWLTDWWNGLISKDKFSIEQLDLLPDTQNYIKDAFNADINSRVIDENNLTNALRNTALAVRNVAEANEERIRTEKELSAEVERVYEGEFVQEGQRSSRNMKRTKVANGLYEYEEEISPGRKRRYQERFNTKTQQWDKNEIISTDYDKLVSEAVDATIKLTKAQHDLNIEQSKQSPNIDFIMEYNAQIREAQERLDRATLSASNFAQEVVRIVNDPAYDTKYVMGMFNDAVNEQSFFKLSDENIRFYGKLRRENESTQKSIDATTKALAVFENQVRNVEYSYDQTLSPGITKPVTRQSDLDELTTKRDEILTRINNLKGTSATVQDITDIRKLINEYQLLAKAKRDANNVVDKNLGGETLEVKVSKQIANIDKLIAKSEQYSDATKDITDKLKQQKQALENTITTDPTSGKTSTSIEAKDFYDIQSNVKILGSQLDSNIVKLKEQKKLVNEYLKAYANQQKSLNKIQVLQEEGEAQNKNAIAAETQKMQKAAKELQKAENTLKNQGFDFSSIQNEIDTINAEKGEIIGKYYDQVNTKNYKNLNTDYLSLDKITQSGDKYTDSFITKVNTLKAELRALMDQGLDFNNQDAKAKLDEIRQKVEAIKSEAKFDDVQLALNNTIEKTKLKISKFMSENSAMTDEYRSKLQDLEVRLNGADLTKAEVNSIVDSFIRLETEITKAGKTGKSFFATITDRLKGLNAQLIARYLSIYDIIRYTRTAVSTIKELDTQLVDLRKTTTMTSSELEKFYHSSSDVAKQLGVTSSEIIQQAANWSRLGYSTKEAATEMAKLSSQFATISPGMDTETAQQGLVSIMKSWKLDVADVESEIMDKINTLGLLKPKLVVIQGVA